MTSALTGRRSVHPAADDDFEIIKQNQLVGNGLDVPKGHTLGFTCFLICNSFSIKYDETFFKSSFNMSSILSTFLVETKIKVSSANRITHTLQLTFSTHKNKLYLERTL